MSRASKDVVYGGVEVQMFQKVMEGWIVHYQCQCRDLKSGLFVTGDP